MSGWGFEKVLIKHLIKSNSAYNEGWRKIEHCRRTLKIQMRELSHATVYKSKNRQTRLQKAAKEYLRTAGQLSGKLHKIRISGALSVVDLVLLEQLEYFCKMLA